MASLLLLQTPMVQTYVANRVLDELSVHIDGKVTFERIHFKPFSHLILKNLVIVDNDPYTDQTDPDCQVIDTLVKAKYLIADFSLKTLTENEGLHFNEVTLKDAQLNLILEEDENETGKAHTTNLTRIFKLDQRKKKEKTDKEIFLIKKVKVANMTYVMKNYSNKKTPFRGGINWNDLEANNIYINANDLTFKGGVMSGQANEVSFTEKSGYICNSMSGYAKVGNGLTHLTDFVLIDPWSVITFTDGKLKYDNIKAFSDYTHKVVMDVNIGNSLIDFTSISYFAPQLKGNKLRVKVSNGKYYGTVDDFTITDMGVEMEEGGFSAVVSGRLAGIPEVMETTLDAELKNCVLTTKGLSTFVTYWMRGGKLDLSKIAPNEIFRLDGKVNGSLNRMTVQPVITSRIGMATGSDVCIDNILETEEPINISGTINIRVTGAITQLISKH